MNALAAPSLRSRVLERLEAIRPPVTVIADDEGLKPFETDALIAHRETPMLAALPESESQVREIVAACSALGVPVVSRGAGTGISGGAIPHRDGVLLVLSKMRRVVEVDGLSRTATVEPGVRNLFVSQVAAPMACAVAPMTWPSTICGLTRLPQSSTTAYSTIS